MICKICNRECKNIRAVTSHVISYHKLTLIDYLIKYENFEKPKCVICGNECKLCKSNLFLKSCGSKNCKKINSKNRKHSVETKEKMRKNRLDYMKNNPDKTAWRLQTPSFPEKYFENKLIENGYDKKFSIIKEKSVFPYFIDFAFENEMVAVEIDGSQHESEDRKTKDIFKDEILIRCGWTVFRIKVSQLLSKTNEVLEELNIILGNPNNKTNKCGIKTNKDIKNENILLNKLYKNQYVDKKKNDIICSGIDFTIFGCLTKLSKIMNQSSRSLGKWIKKYLPELYSTIQKRRIEKYKKYCNKLVIKPCLDILINEIKFIGISGAAKRYQVSNTTIRRWVGLIKK